MSIPEEFRFLLDIGSNFVPKTQSAALKAVEGGYLPEAAFIFKGVNIRPVFEEPYDLMELERLLAKPELDSETGMLLMQVFEKLIKNPDKELALFAAESINAIEVRSVHRIQKLKKSVEAQFDPEVARRLAQAFFELGKFNFARPMLKSFYLNEARQVLEDLWRHEGSAFVDWETSVLIFLELNQSAEAAALLKRILETDGQNLRVFLWMARVKFVQGDLLEVMAILAFLNNESLLPEAQSYYQFWMGESDHV